MKINAVATVVLAGLSCSPCAAQFTPEQEKWLESDALEVPALEVSEGELRFLAHTDNQAVPHSENILIINRDSLDTGWVRLRQCHHRLDAFHTLDIVYRYERIRGLRIVEQHGIGSARVVDNAVEMTDIERDNRICVEADVRVLRADDGHHFRLTSGPYYRRFLDGYYAYHISLDISYPHERLALVRTTPEPQMGFTADHRRGRTKIDAWFEGRLKIELTFARKDPWR